jgi:tetratricopeptide (TPR) repeat protein
VALAACALLTGKQIQYWRNGETLCAHNLEVDPANFMAQCSLATFYLNDGQLERARVEGEKAVLLNPRYPISRLVLGKVLLLQGKHDQAAAQLAASLRLEPASNDAHLLYGHILLAQNLPAEAEQQFTTVLSIDPVIPEAHFGLGQALVKQGKPDEACSELEKALRLAPQYAEARLQLAIALARQGKTADAIAQYRLARNVPPSAPDSGVMNNLAWILAASPSPEFRNGAEAVKLAARACELDHDQPMFIGTLAAAYAEAGRFDEAVTAAQKAHDMAEAKGLKALAARNLELLKIYSSRQPYREKNSS